MSINEFIRHVDREIAGTRDYPPAGEFPSLPGADAEACLLPDFGTEWAYRKRYGVPPFGGEDPRSIEALSQLCQGGTQMIDEFVAFARIHFGRDVLDAAEATLRSIGRLERCMEPLFTGLAMPTFGLVRSACIAGRARVGDVVDQKALAGEL